MRTQTDRKGASEDLVRELLAMVERMASDIDAWDLDRIDGEFFWLWCHREVLPIIKELRAIKESGCVHYRDDYIPDRLGFMRNAPSHEETAGTWWPFVDERSYRIYLHYLDLMQKAEAIVLPTIVGTLLAGKPITLRPTEATLNMRVFKDGKEAWFVLVLVHSSGSVGSDVEADIDELVDEFNIPRDDPAPPDYHRTAAEYMLMTDRTVLRALILNIKADEVKLPCIGVVAELPLCTPGGIGREYDAIVRTHHQWHLRLPGAGATRQDKEVAVRTWGVGALLGLGMRFGEALRRVCEAGQLAEVSQTRFGVDRKGLIKRVPEAGPFLMQRQAPGEGLQTA